MARTSKTEVSRSANGLRGREQQVLFELLKDGRIPDKHIAKKIGTTQPTVTRIRQKLERERFIKKYKALADYEKTGIGLVAFTFFTWGDYTKDSLRESYRAFLLKQPQVMFAARGEGIEGRTTCIISAHRDFKEYEDFVRELRKVGGVNVVRVTQFFSAPGGFLKQYDSTDPVIHAMEGGKKG